MRNSTLKKLSPVSNIISAYKNGESLKSIGSRYGVADKTIVKLLDMKGIDRKPPGWNNMNRNNNVIALAKKNKIVAALASWR